MNNGSDEKKEWEGEGELRKKRRMIEMESGYERGTEIWP